MVDAFHDIDFDEISNVGFCNPCNFGMNVDKWCTEEGYIDGTEVDFPWFAFGDEEEIFEHNNYYYQCCTCSHSDRKRNRE